MNATMNLPYLFSVANGRADIAVRFNVKALALLPISVALVGALHIEGAALSWVGYHAIAYLGMIPGIASDCLGLKPWRWHLHVARAALTGILSYGVSYLVATVILREGATAAAVGFLVGSLVFTSAAWRMIGDELRGTVHGLRRTLPIRTHRPR
jgi:O-antigen/teichoic acid export membrane protein